jgi:SDR family mycofactocin-dependent oxidoreductase
MMGTLDGKVAFITGAARGQGRSHAIRLAQEGADIIAVDLCSDIDTVPYPLGTKSDLWETVTSVESLDRRIVAEQADVRDRRSLTAAFEKGFHEFGRVDIVLANAGIAPMGGDESDRDRVWRDVIEVNLTGVWNTVEAAVSRMIDAERGGSIVLTSSTAGLKGLSNGTVGGAAYAASKHGVVGIMRGLAKDLAPHSIRVNTVHPTGVATPMIMNESLGALLASNATLAESLANALPVAMIEPVDISNAIAWLVSDAARYVTGVALPVDAGFTL